jgi:hypothetical protein
MSSLRVCNFYWSWHSCIVDNDPLLYIYLLHFAESLLHWWLSGLMVLPWLRRLADDLSPQSPGFTTGSFHTRFVVDEVALGQDFSDFFGFTCQCHSTVPLHTLVSPAGWTIGPLVAQVRRQSQPINMKNMSVCMYICRPLFNTFKMHGCLELTLWSRIRERERERKSIIFVRRFPGYARSSFW